MTGCINGPCIEYIVIYGSKTRGSFRLNRADVLGIRFNDREPDTVYLNMKFVKDVSFTLYGANPGTGERLFKKLVDWFESDDQNHTLLLRFVSGEENE